MARIIGYERHEYHIPAEGNYPARDFEGFKIYLSAPVDPGKGIGESSAVYPVALEQFPQIFVGHTVAELPDLVGEEVHYELTPVNNGKKFILTSCILIKDLLAKYTGSKKQ